MDGKKLLDNGIMKSEDMLQMVINNVPQHIFWKDKNFVFMGCNRNFAKSVGLESPDQIIGKTDFDLSEEKEAIKFIEVDKKVIKNKKPIYGIHECHKDAQGKEVWLNVNKIPLCDENGEVIGILGTFEDITEKVLLSKKLSKNAKKYKDIIDKTNTAYMILDEKLHIVESNQVLSQIMGMSHKDIVGRSPREWINNGDIFVFDSSFKKLFEGDPINDLELVFINDSNKSKKVSISANIIENGGKKIFCLLRDMSKKKIEEERMYIQEQKKKDKIKQNIIEIRSRLRDIRKG